MVYGGQKINGQSLYYFDPHTSFWTCIKSPSNEQNEVKKRSQYWMGQKFQIFNCDTNNHKKIPQSTYMT